MKKILGTTIVLLGAAALSATAATVQIDLSGYDSGSDVNSSFQAYRGDPSAMANHLNDQRQICLVESKRTPLSIAANALKQFINNYIETKLQDNL